MYYFVEVVYSFSQIDLDDAFHQNIRLFCLEQRTFCNEFIAFVDGNIMIYK